MGVRKLEAILGAPSGLNISTNKDALEQMAAPGAQLHVQAGCQHLAPIALVARIRKGRQSNAK